MVTFISFDLNQAYHERDEKKVLFVGRKKGLLENLNNYNYVSMF